MTVQTKAMKVHVFDTHVTTASGNYYHFDVLVSDETAGRATEYAEMYMKKLGLIDTEIKQKRCDFCHSELANPTVQDAILAHGYYIVPMQGCPQS